MLPLSSVAAPLQPTASPQSVFNLDCTPRSEILAPCFPDATTQVKARPIDSQAINIVLMNRRDFLRLAALAGAAALTTPSLAYTATGTSAPSGASHVKPFVLDEFTISQLQGLMASGKDSAVSLAK